MSIEMNNRIKGLRIDVDELKKSLQEVIRILQSSETAASLTPRVEKLENQYRMLNARESRGKNDG